MLGKAVFTTELSMKMISTLTDMTASTHHRLAPRSV